MWTDERVKQLREMWTKGLSASQIAGRLGGVTRNAVIEKLHRMGLSGRGSVTRTSRMRSRAPTASRAQCRAAKNQVTKIKAASPKVRRQAAPTPRPTSFSPAQKPNAGLLVPAAAPPVERKTILALGINDCRWPIGDPQDNDFHFCGKDKVPGLPYCEAHVHRAYKTPESTADRKRQRGYYAYLTDGQRRQKTNEEVS